MLFWGPLHAWFGIRMTYEKNLGGVKPIFTNAFLEQIRTIMENLSNTKVFKLTKGCLKKLARAKNALRAHKIKIAFLEQLISSPPYKYKTIVFQYQTKHPEVPTIARTATPFNI